MLKNLLIVEDNAAMRRLIKSVVADLASNIHECQDGSEALAAYKEHNPEWVVMDVEMKETDGISATRDIINSYPNANILILTRDGSERLRARAKEAGAAWFVLKEDLLSIRRMTSIVAGHRDYPADCL